uniref:Uncharacterized protein n=1 Tax=viral metagenome TaxID=1070528 RepID=A0A6M3IY18_9ZZZZ
MIEDNDSSTITKYEGDEWYCPNCLEYIAQQDPNTMATISEPGVMRLIEEHGDIQIYACSECGHRIVMDGGGRNC